MPNNKNLKIVEELKNKIEKSKTILFADYRGLSAEQINELRSKIKNEGGEVVVAKNTLIKEALKQNNIDTKVLDNDLKGPTTAVFSYDDEISNIKTIVEYAKDTELPKVKSALVEGVYANSSKVLEISEIPSKEELVARLVGGLKSPLSGLTNTLGGVQRKFVYAVNAIKTKKEGGVQE
jgi:large subunit ribosomal protein L10